MNEHGDQGPPDERSVPRDGEAAELLREGFDAYCRLMRIWLDGGREPAEGKSGVANDVWSGWFTNLYKIMFNAIPGPQYMLKDAKSTGANTPETLFGDWKPFLFALSSDPDSLRRGMKIFIDYSRSWQDNFNRLYDAWIKCLEKTSDAIRSAGEGESQISLAVTAGMESSREFMDIWRQYAMDQASAFSHFTTSLRQQDAGRGVAGKPERKTKNPRMRDGT